MEALIYLIPVALFLGLVGLAAFLWALKTGQFDDLDGAAERILFDDDEDAGPSPKKPGGARIEPSKHG
ncbi:cytochrome oxidase maturation protein, cbb3-type [Hypericibacter adhaerens]|uniref:Cytochrome oxidase maturation protein, cbb3-type n=1 Tax=Hypericibacter adhaerens TaxID=2602016 RepID=A0A5J6N1I6_9PROT|nr:cbb3-type cytochrome oxidase assembly protein CcoS [Hypericibacter adhaerens]QEX20766.1 cytochrome oxidase maturation protein, cbb3-type [Hypericibacter adhaerens]